MKTFLIDFENKKIFQILKSLNRRSNQFDHMCSSTTQTLKSNTTLYEMYMEQQIYYGYYSETINTKENKFP